MNEEIVEALRAEIAELETRLTALRAQLAEMQKGGPLTVYPSVESIEWAAERYEDTPETRTKFNDLFLTWALLGSKETEWYPPYKNVIVEGIGEVRHIPGGWMPEKNRGGRAGPDWVHIADGILDVTARPWVQRVDEDGRFDPAEKEALVRGYSGGLRYPLQAWDAHSVGAAYKKIYLSTHFDPGGDYHVAQIPVTPAG